jgi:hypothetical protein
MLTAEMPSHATLVRHQKARAEALFAESDAWDRICVQVSEGGSLVDLCQVWDLRYSDATAWLCGDLERREAYEFALQPGGEWAREMLLRDLEAIAFADIRQAFDMNGALLPPAQMPTPVARAVAAIDVVEGSNGRVTRRVRFHDKLRALELLARYLRTPAGQGKSSSGPDLEELVMASLQDPERNAA